MKPELILCNGWRGVQAHVLDVLTEASSRGALTLADILIAVPTTAAGHLVRTGLEQTLLADGSARVLPAITTISQMLGHLAERSLGAVRIADPLTREAVLDQSLQEAAESGCSPPFTYRGSLAPRILAFYDHLHLTGHGLEAFASRAFEEFDVPGDTGAERMAAQTRFLIEGLGRYRETLGELTLEDTPTLRAALAERGGKFPYRKVIVWGAGTLQPVDIAFLASTQGPESLEIVIPESMSTTYRVRSLQKLVPMEILEQRTPLAHPVLLTAAESSVFVLRDREEVLVEVARFLKAQDSAGKLPPLEQVAVVVPTPLPYLYLVKKIFDQAGIPYELQDDFPLATEPYVAAVDLALEFVEQGGRRPAALGLLRSPFYRFAGVDSAVVANLDDELRRRHDPGGFEAWRRMRERWRRRPLQRALPGMEDLGRQVTPISALDALVAIGNRLAPLANPDSSMTDKIEVLAAFLEACGQALPAMENSERHLRSRGALLSIMERLSDAARLVGDPAINYSAFREKLHRAIESHTFSMRSGSGGVQVVDARSAGYGSFELVILVGLNEGEWPSRSERNIFYPQWMLKDFGWPTDVDSLAHERAAFVELVLLASGSVVAFRHQLEDEIPTVASPFLEEIEAATGDEQEKGVTEEMAGLLVSRSEALRAAALPKAKHFQRRRRPGLLSRPVYDPEPVSATAFEMYLRCPFKHYARYVLRLEEEEDLDEGLSPMERGRILHDILQSGFEKWDARGAGPRPIVADNYAEAMRLFRSVAAEKLPRERRALEMEWLFGGAGERGSIEWLLRLEMSRGRLRRRLLEHAFQNRYRLAKGPKGETPWLVRIKGRADRVDIDSDGHLRLFDYKSGRAPESKITVQVPLYALCLSQDFRCSTAEAAYLSLRDKRSVARQDTSQAEQLVRETYREITEGRFPPRPYQDRLCNTCGYLGLCRKEIEETQAGKEGEAS